MFFEKKKNLLIGRSALLYNNPRVIHGFSTRKGGVSQPPFDALNLGVNTPDQRENIIQNQNLFFNSLHISQNSLAIPTQVHSDRVVPVESAGSFQDTDGLISCRPELILVIQLADCVPVYLYDPKKRAVGLIHAGWRGSSLRIAEKAVDMMRQVFSCKPDDMLAVIGPSIGPCCYQVGSGTAGQFESAFLHGDHLDLWTVNHRQLTDAGLPTENIEISRLCTCCHGHWFFSHRRDKGRTGRMMAFLGIV